MQYARVAAVTGANKGVGHAIVRNLALQYASSPLNTGPLLIYLTARSQMRGEAALESIYNDPALKQAKALLRDGGLADVKYSLLDVADADSVKAFETFLAQEHKDGLDVLVNNAGVSLDGLDSNTARDTLATNYHGAINLTTTLLPHVRKRGPAGGGRIVNMSSMLGKMNKYSPTLTAQFRDASEVRHITALMDQFQASVDKGSVADDGWPSSAYSVSKAGLTGATMLIGKEELKNKTGVLVNACCPGYVSTDMTKNRGRKTPDQGAQTPVLLALGDLKGVGGEFWEREEVSSW